MKLYSLAGVSLLLEINGFRGRLENIGGSEWLNCEASQAVKRGTSPRVNHSDGINSLRPLERTRPRKGKR